MLAEINRIERKLIANCIYMQIWYFFALHVSKVAKQGIFSVSVHVCVSVCLHNN